MIDIDTGTLQAIADSVGGALASCDDAPLALALLRELALGEPVIAAALAAATARDEATVVAALARSPNVELDDRGHVVAFSGLSIRPTGHRFEVGARQLYTWCAWDTLFMPAMLSQPARVHSRCPVTGAEVRLTVEPDGVRDSDPEPLWVSFPPPGAASIDDITGSFCCHVHFLAGPGAADRWHADHGGSLVLTLDEAFALGRLAARPCLEAR